MSSQETVIILNLEEVQALDLSTVTEEKKWQGTKDDYSSIGFGGLLRVEANTALSENFYANIGGDLRYDVNGEPENNNGK